jgi:hypothetical protein
MGYYFDKDLITWRVFFPLEIQIQILEHDVGDIDTLCGAK